MFVDSYRPDISRFINCTAFPVGNDPKRIGREPTRQCQWEIGKLQFCASALLDQKLEIRDQDLTDCMSSEHFRQSAWQLRECLAHLTREFAAWLGLVPRQNSTGGKHRLGGISKRGNQYLRRLLINGASANLLRSKATNADPWVIGLRQRRPSLVVAVALANKTARIAWAVMHRHENYQRVVAAA